MVKKEPVTGKGEQTRQLIFKSALAVFREDGFDAATMQQVATRAGVVKSAAYYYFPIVAMAARLPFAGVAAAMILLDLLIMPLCRPVVMLGPGWGWGEALAAAMILLPALALGRWTLEDERLRARAAMQVALAWDHAILQPYRFVGNTVRGWFDKKKRTIIRFAAAGTTLRSCLRGFIECAVLCVAPCSCSFSRAFRRPWSRRVFPCPG